MSATRTLLAPVVALAVSLGGAATANPTDNPCAPAAPHDTPLSGTVRTLPVLSVSLAVGSTGRESKRAVYSPPPGWYVRSHRVQVASRYGTVTYAVSTVPAGFDWRTDEQSASAGKSSTTGAVSAYKISGGGQLATVRDLNAADHQTVATSHHVLVIDVTARGAGFLQSGSGIDLTVMAEMVYLGR
ncbi:hypothetical protein GobsT_65450 [Gemmata obscuriglobus]|uniref:Uncharacterized protein n=1 Tax=Gemmata obscuriglobus TaxID=114 RepID=A0A2Z3GUN1_9BACT|nr:hypothetical protein [Gemmata obscuriglobus]AWM35762.1 hypothetical protein C1280_01125 [Gemmata obscuriglobus]QEG31701.1 hypothetical protein GobsT_65450 [Gemmata obscuriglobus]VTS11047.1 unnamed protein product [Gemmata obscuriglobus UQM 2246]